jgi:hypothetical protein
MRRGIVFKEYKGSRRKLRTYKASELIMRLQELIGIYGDLPVVVHPVGADVISETGILFNPKDDIEQYCDRFEITDCYDYRGDRPIGNVDEEPSPLDYKRDRE